MNIIIEITSSNYNSIKYFYRILVDKLSKIKKLRFSITNKINKTRNKKKFTVLKSPHVNKDAREQFEITYHKKIVKIHSYQYFLLLFLIKRIKTSLSSDVHLKIYFEYNLNHFHKRLKSNLNSNSRFLVTSKSNISKKGFLVKNFDSTKNYLKHLDVFGESAFKNR